MSAETHAIMAVIHEYLDGLYHCDTLRLSQVFHHKALYATVSGDAPIFLTMDEYFPLVEKRDPPSRTHVLRKERVLHVAMAGRDTAFVKLECTFFQKNYIDFLTLIKVAERWQIIAKVFHYNTSA